jgi:ubiquinone/menaquinone biosynthesis C-methylase UbiE/uncharacterized protein YbaR (Trm112 family)
MTAEAGVLEVGGVPLVCPYCREKIRARGESLQCTACSRQFPLVDGIPDLRVAPDPWIGFEEDREKARRLLGESRGESFADMVRTYWSLTPDTPAERAERFIAHVLSARDRSREWLEVAAGVHSAATGPWLDAGCGTADLAAAAPDDVPVVGVDLAMRWLVAAKRRLAEARREAHLVCANAEALPFPDASFGSVLSLGMLEHCERPGPVLAEARRVLRPGGRLLLRTVNRFSVLAEPHVNIWGVGWLPRAWASAYVRARTGASYDHHRALSARELDRELRRAGFEAVEVSAAAALRTESATAGRLVRRLTPLYERLRVSGLLGRSVAWVAPLLEARAVAR